MKNDLPSLDAFDLKILRILQDDNTTSQREISDQVALSPAAVHRRIRRLNENGVVRRNVAVVTPEKVGRPITIITDVAVEREGTAELQALKDLFASTPQVQQCYYVTGEIDFILVFTVVDMQEYEDLTKKLFFEHENITRFRTYVAMDRVKTTLDVMI